jgi:hypothetical protein
VNPGGRLHEKQFPTARVFLDRSSISVPGHTGHAPKLRGAPCGRNAICGLGNPEDAVRLGGTRFVIASSLAPGADSQGHLHLVDLASRDTAPLVPMGPDTRRSLDPGCAPLQDFRTLITRYIEPVRQSGSWLASRGQPSRQTVHRDVRVACARWACRIVLAGLRPRSADGLGECCGAVA